MATNGFAYWIVARNLYGDMAWLVGPILDPQVAGVTFFAVRDEAWLYIMNEDVVTWEYGIARTQAQFVDEMPTGQLNDKFLATTT